MGCQPAAGALPSGQRLAAATESMARSIGVPCASVAAASAWQGCSVEHGRGARQPYDGLRRAWRSIRRAWPHGAWQDCTAAGRRLGASRVRLWPRGERWALVGRVSRRANDCRNSNSAHRRPGRVPGVLAAQSPARSTTQLPMAHRKASRAARQRPGRSPVARRSQAIDCRGKVQKVRFSSPQGLTPPPRGWITKLK